MRLALLSDAHCNSVGLAACLEQIARLDVDEVYFLGDAVGYLADPAPVLRLLEDAGASCQQGNHEAMLLGDLPLDPRRDALYGLARQRRTIADADLERLASWPIVRRLERDGLRLLLSHGSPAPSLTERVHADTPWRPDEGFPHDVVFIGHTHRPFVRETGDVQLINVGSCGLPRDRGDLAAFVVYDCSARAAEMYRVPFDVGEAITRHGAGVAPEVLDVLGRRGEYRGALIGKDR